MSFFAHEKQREAFAKQNDRSVIPLGAGMARHSQNGAAAAGIQQDEVKVTVSICFRSFHGS